MPRPRSSNPTKGALATRACRERKKAGDVRGWITIPKSFIDALIRRGLTSEAELVAKPETPLEIGGDLLDLWAEDRLTTDSLAQSSNPVTNTSTSSGEN